MHKHFSTYKILLVLILIPAFYQSMEVQAQSKSEARVEKRQKKILNRLTDVPLYFEQWKHLGKLKIDSLELRVPEKQLILFLNPDISHIAWRPVMIEDFEEFLKYAVGRKYRNYQIQLLCRSMPLAEFIPNYYRTKSQVTDSARIRPLHSVAPLVHRRQQGNFSGGLSNRHIALWHSHGYYYNQEKDRWQWQRARLFGTIEDLFPMEFVLKFLAPMLENAGAQVLIPRERDTQSHEVIVDWDVSDGTSEIIINPVEGNYLVQAGGFKKTDTLFDGQNPFQSGSYIRLENKPEASIQYVPDIPESGNYAVYFSWGKSEQALERVNLKLNYGGGQAEFFVNQQMGWNTWVYLGHFYFEKGKNPQKGSLIVLGSEGAQGIITADAARFGGGMGNVARRKAGQSSPNRLSATDGNASEGNLSSIDAPVFMPDWKISQRPRYMEGARYFLQYAGMPDTLIYSLNDGKNDYNDDYMSRGEWVNYLMGEPLGPQRDRDHPGLNIPVDLALAFHTDAGITPMDSVIGTLAIYSAQREKGFFPDGISKMGSRDLADIVQSQITQDIQNLFFPRWSRRALWDRQYSEAWRPNTPALLLELLSHQNLADMRFALDPQFQFAVSRAIYKGILRFVASAHNFEPIIQPLPPTHLSIEKTDTRKIRISWLAQPDPLEPSAVADSFRLYMRSGGTGFDLGTVVNNSSIELELPQYSTIYSFYVTALNRGGESFPSEILVACINEQNPEPYLIVNAFERISGPEIFNTETLAGLSFSDGWPVPYHTSYAFTGMQYDYRKSSPWLDDDSPGWGASYADMEGQALTGNSFDNALIYGQALAEAQRSFVSVSRKAFENPDFKTLGYKSVFVILGKQKSTPSLLDADSILFPVFTHGLIQQLQNFAARNGNIFISGAYIGTDMIMQKDTLAQHFAKKTLGFTWRTNNACNSGQVFLTDQAKGLFPPHLHFNTQWISGFYPVEAPDAIEPWSKESKTIFRYASNKTSAAILLKSKHTAISLGFPFEAIPDAHQRNLFMKNIIQLFENHTTPFIYD